MALKGLKCVFAYKRVWSSRGDNARLIDRTSTSSYKLTGLLYLASGICRHGKRTAFYVSSSTSGIKTKGNVLGCLGNCSLLANIGQWRIVSFVSKKQSGLQTKATSCHRKSGFFIVCAHKTLACQLWRKLFFHCLRKQSTIACRLWNSMSLEGKTVFFALSLLLICRRKATESTSLSAVLTGGQSSLENCSSGLSFGMSAHRLFAYWGHDEGNSSFHNSTNH